MGALLSPAPPKNKTHNATNELENLWDFGMARSVTGVLEASNVALDSKKLDTLLRQAETLLQELKFKSWAASVHSAIKY